MTKAYSYIRMSSEVQLKGDSLRRQLELSKQYAMAHGLDLVEEINGVQLQDIGISGYRGAHTESGSLATFLDALKAGKIEKGSYLLVESFDRLSRENIAIALGRFMEMIGHGLTIVTLDDGQVYSETTLQGNSSMLFVSLGSMIRANEESELKSKRLSASWANKRSNASTKRLTSVTPAWISIDKTSDTMILHQEKSAVVKEIFKMCATKTGMHGIVTHLNKNHVPVFGRSKSWGKSYISKILNNRSVLGEYQPHHMLNGKRTPIGEPLKNYFPRVIEEELFVRAHAAMERRKLTTAGRKGISFGNIFTGLIFCKDCNAKMLYRDRGASPKGGRTLVCRSKFEGGSCKSPEWKIEEVETAIFKHLKEVDLSSVLNDSRNRVQEINDSLASNDFLISDLKKYQIRVAEMLVKQDLPAAAQEKMTSMLKESEVEITSINTASEGLKIELANILESTSLETTNGLKNFIETYKQNLLNYEFRSSINELLRKAIEKIELKKGYPAIDPTDFDDGSKEIITYRLRSKKASKLRLDQIVVRKSFIEHCEWFSREILIHYKYGDRRHISFGEDLSLSLKNVRNRLINMRPK